MGRTIETDIGIGLGDKLIVTNVRIMHTEESAYPKANAQVLQDIKEILEGLNGAESTGSGTEKWPAKPPPCEPKVGAKG